MLSHKRGIKNPRASIIQTIKEVLKRGIKKSQSIHNIDYTYCDTVQ